MEDYERLALRRLLEQHESAVLETHAQCGDATAVVERARSGEILNFLRDDPQLRFDLLVDLTAVDYYPDPRRFEVVYHLFSTEKRHRVRIKVRVPEDDPQVDSAVGIWPAANWMEREVWDLYGIRFEGHGDLRRILLYEEFDGHPLRKDYPKEKRQPLIGPRN